MLKRNEKLIKYKLWQYLLPGIMLTAALQIGNIVDSMLVGNILGANAMSAVKIGMTVDNIMEIPGYVLGVGGSVAVGILLGKREKDKANKVFSTTVMVSILGGLFFSLMSVFTPFFSGILTGGNEQLMGDVNSFVFVTLLCAPVISLALQFMNYVAVDNNPTIASAYVITANVINLTFDYIILSFTPFGTAGAALSTALGYGLGMVVLVLYLKSSKRMLRFVNPFKNSGSALKLALTTGMPTMMYMVFVTVKDFALNTMIVNVIGNDAMAVYTVCANVVLIVELLVGGIIGTLSSIGGVVFGEKDYFSVRALSKNVLIYSYTVLAAVLVILYVFTGWVVGFFGISEGPLLEVSIEALRIFVLCLPFYMLNKFMQTYYQSTEKTKLSSVVASMQNCLAIVPLAFITVYIAGGLGLNRLYALMIAFVLAEIITIFVATVYRMIKYKKQGFLIIPKDTDDTSYDVSINGNMEDTEKIPREIIAFCNEKGIDSSKANLVAVAAEEMVVNIIRYGGKNAKTVDLNLSVTDNSLILRTRDNGIPFNPMEYTVDSDEFEIHGIEVIKKITDKMQYLRVLDLNNTVVEIKL